MGVICGSAFAGGAAEAKKAAKIPSTVTLAATPDVAAVNLGIFDPPGRLYAWTYNAHSIPRFQCSPKSAKYFGGKMSVLLGKWPISANYSLR
jgi:hypothetical protein